MDYVCVLRELDTRKKNSLSESLCHRAMSKIYYHFIEHFVKRGIVTFIFHW